MTGRQAPYQLAFLDTPAHAAVSATVEAAPRKVRGLVNAVLRRVADSARSWPDDATRLSYPDWIIDRLTHDLGHDLPHDAPHDDGHDAEPPESAMGDLLHPAERTQPLPQPLALPERMDGLPEAGAAKR